MRISRKAVSYLLEDYYRATSLREIRQGALRGITRDIFASSLITAGRIEDFEFLEVMVESSDRLDRDWGIYLDRHGEVISISAGGGVPLIEFAALAIHCSEKISQTAFEDVLLSQADSLGAIQRAKSSEEYLEEFRLYVKVINEILKD